MALTIESLHHVSLPVTDVERSRRFYRDVLGLAEIDRPPFDFAGAWFAVGSAGQQLHLIAGGSGAPTFRSGKGVDSRDVHFAVRVPDYMAALRDLRAAGYGEATADELLRMKVNPKATAGFPQIYILDPDRNVIEINADRLDA
ncbi:MAG: VOC family protein [Bauldia sp.]|jgi:catechol 2,3-dioxygenase-like lactoylglutathione lyase family enzyme